MKIIFTLAVVLCCLAYVVYVAFNAATTLGYVSAPTSVTASTGVNAATGASSLDDAAFLACRQFATLYADLKAGTISNAELRVGLKNVYIQARVYPTSAVTQASASMLQTTTTSSMIAMMNACGGGK